MTVVYESVELLANFIEMFVLYRIFDILLHKQRGDRDKNYDICFAIVGANIIQLCNHILLFSYFTMLIFVLYVVISATYLYKTKIVLFFSIVSFYLLSLSCFDFIIFTFVSNFYGGYETFIELVSQRGLLRLSIISMIKCLWMLVYIILKKYFSNFLLKKNYVYTILSVSCTGFLGFIYLVNQTFMAFDITMTGIWFVFLALFSLILFAAYFVIESREEKMKLNFLEMRNQLLEENYKAINEIYSSNSKLYHDLNNHLNVLYQLLDRENVIEAKRYIKEISKPILKLSHVTWTGVDVVDVIINSKIQKMKEKGIPFDINVEFPQNTNILPHDICTILSNLLDNAIEASSKLDKSGSVLLTIRKINYFLMINVVNECFQKGSDFINYPKTTKENKELHGWGLPSVRDAVEKYNGTLRCINKDNQFAVSIMLFYEASST